ncbi:MAG: hypothetical protein IKM48_07950, partial [Clostridia bacterium]|nr:hypothetical protein [Clostridia bacterium]
MKKFQKGGTDYISGLIEAAVKDGSRTATVRGNYEIESVIRIPSDFTLILDGCHLCMADGVYSNMFTNQSRETEGAKKAAGADRNIIILGQNDPILDGGNYNGLSEKTSGKNGYPHITRNNAILFYNIRNFVLENFQIRNQRWWAINLIHAEQGRISNLNIEGQCHCANQDGID